MYVGGFLTMMTVGRVYNSLLGGSGTIYNYFQVLVRTVKWQVMTYMLTLML